MIKCSNKWTLVFLVIVTIMISKSCAKKSADTDDKSWKGNSSTETAVPRVFGRLRRIQFLLLPLAFKMGIVATMIFILVLLSLKNLLIGKTILLLNGGFMLFKLLGALIKIKGHVHGGFGGGMGGGHGGWMDKFDPQKNVHIHVHGADVAHGATAGGSYEKTVTEYALPAHYSQAYQGYRNVGNLAVEA